MNSLSDNDVFEGIKRQLHAAKKPLIVSHIRPDGDAIGSIIGLGLALKDAGKAPLLVLSDGLPSKFRFLSGSEDITNTAKDLFDLTIALDCADPNRLGEDFSSIHFDINIDHHITNNGFGSLNLILPQRAATAEILADILPQLNFSISSDAASALLMGIVTDTIGFRTSNVSTDTLRITAELMGRGANLSELYDKALANQSFEAIKLWGLALARLDRKGDLIWTEIRLEDRLVAGYSGKDDADLTNILSAVEGVKVAILFNEQKNGKVKVSWRSGPEVDVSKIALSFGGGGHPPAAGAELKGNLAEVQELVLDRTRQIIGV